MMHTGVDGALKCKAEVSGESFPTWITKSNV